MDLKAGVGLLSVLGGLLYSALAEKGVMALIRIRKTQTGWKAQSVIDWDCDAYEALVDEAGRIKALKVKKVKSKTNSTEVENTNG